MNRSVLVFFMAVLVLWSGVASADSVTREWEALYPLGIFTTPTALKTDSRGNVYVTGAAYDTGPGTTVKYDADGNQMWAQAIGGMALAVDAADNVYATGASQTAKYDVDGNLVWMNDLQGQGLAVDAGQNVYVTGSFGTAKIDALGTVLWTRPEGGQVITIGSNGSIYVAYIFTAFNGAVTYTLDPDGNLAATAQYNGPSEASSFVLAKIKIDAVGNTYAVGSARRNSTGYSAMLTLKYDAAGNTLWESLYGGSSYSTCTGYSLDIDKLGNVFIIGTDSYFGWNTTIIKYDQNGWWQWGTYAWNGYARNIAVDDNNDVYFTTSVMAMVKLKAWGGGAWSIGSGFFERASRDTIGFDASGNLYAVGWRGENSVQNYVTVKYSQVVTYPIEVIAGENGSISPSGVISVVLGEDQTFIITPDTGYHIADVMVDGSSVGAVTSYTFNNVTAYHTISATFVINTYTVTPAPGTNGSMSPSTPQTVNYNQTTSFTITPNTGFFIASVTGCGGTLTGNTYTTGLITADCSVTATFGQYITVTVPNGGESWPRGTTQIIRWTYAGNPGTSVKIELLKGTTASTIVRSTSIGSNGSGSYSWKVPAKQATGSNYKVRVTSTSNSNYTDSSNGNFSIQ